jgi:hypothetical protein
LSQEVTTSDVFTVVTSQPLISFFRNGTGTDVEGDEVPIEIDLAAPYPNPFNPVTSINFNVAAVGPVSISVFDVLGRRVTDLLDNDIRAIGTHQIRFDAGDLSSGVYVVRMTAGGFSSSRSIVLLK